MKGRDMLMILAHLFRKRGREVNIEDAVRFLSFQCRYGRPTEVRRMLTLALNHEMISREGDHIRAEFLYHQQYLAPDMATTMRVQVSNSVEPMS
ncbi:MAG: hypothetical protein ACTSV3_00320 [Candidatus Thorarchaeota archaeon]